MMGNPLMNDAQLSQTADRVKTRQPGFFVKPTLIALSRCWTLKVYQAHRNVFGQLLVTTQHNQFTAVLSRFGPAGTPSRASYHQGVAQYKHERALSCLATTRPLVKPTWIVLS